MEKVNEDRAEVAVESEEVGVAFPVQLGNVLPLV